MKPSIFYVYKKNWSRELSYSIKSLKNVPHSDVYIIGDKPDYEVPATIIAPRPHQMPHSAYIDVFVKTLTACQEIESDYLLMMNDDFYIMPYKCASYDDVDYDIIDIYDMYNRWMQEQSTGSRCVQEAPYRQEVQTTRMREGGGSSLTMPDALQEKKSIRNTRSGIANSREVWDEVDKDILRVAKYETEVHESEKPWLQELRWQGDNSMREMAEVFRLLRRYGRQAREIDSGQDRQQQGILERKLPMGDVREANEKQKKLNYDNLRRENFMYSRLVGYNWDCTVDFIKTAGFSIKETFWRPQYYDRGSLADHIKERQRNDPYKRMLQNTYDYLTAQGESTKDYTTHTPFLYNRKSLLALINQVMPEIKRGKTMSIRTLYGNIFNVPSETIKDVKNPDVYEGLPILSTNEHTFMGSLGNYIREKLHD